MTPAQPRLPHAAARAPGRARLLATGLVLLAAFLPGCSGSSPGGSSAGMGVSQLGTKVVPVPGDTRRAGREGFSVAPVRKLTPEEEAAARARSTEATERLWSQAERLEERDPEEAGEAYREIVEQHPGSPRAAEARFREGRAFVRAGEYREGMEALKAYMDLVPANPHLAEIEQLCFEAGTRYLRSMTGLTAIFMSRDVGYGMLDYIPQAFPNGEYADDALLALGDAYAAEDDKDLWMKAVVAYRSLLLRYPDSELRPRAWLGVARTGLRRDQGTAWHGGYVQLDPREPLPDASQDPAALAFAGPVESGPRLALRACDALLAEEQRAPGRASADDLAQAEALRARARAALAAKEEAIAAWYGNASGGWAADPYRREAARLRGEPPPPLRARPVPPPAAAPAVVVAPPTPPVAPVQPQVVQPAPVQPATPPPAPARPADPAPPAAAPATSPGLPPPAIRRRSAG